MAGPSVVGGGERSHSQVEGIVEAMRGVDGSRQTAEAAPLVRVNGKARPRVAHQASGRWYQVYAPFCAANALGSRVFYQASQTKARTEKKGLYFVERFPRLDSSKMHSWFPAWQRLQGGPFSAPTHFILSRRHTIHALIVRMSIQTETGGQHAP